MGEDIRKINKGEMVGEDGKLNGKRVIDGTWHGGILGSNLDWKRKGRIDCTKILL